MNALILLCGSERGSHHNHNTCVKFSFTVCGRRVGVCLRMLSQWT